MKKKHLIKASLFFGLVIYNILFWQEQLGVNLLIFSFLLGSLAFSLNPESIRSRRAWITAAATLITGIMVVLHNLLLSKTMHIFSFFVMLGFVHQKDIRSVYFSVLTSLTNTIKVPATLVGVKNSSINQGSKWSLIWRYFKISLIPLMIFFLFYFMYKLANPIFSDIASKFWAQMADLLENISMYISWRWLFFMILGLLIIGGVVFNRQIKKFLHKDLSFSDFLTRKKRSRIMDQFQNRMSFKSVSLKDENRAGIILIAMVNLMLLVVNIIDINWIWFGFEVPRDFNLKQFVHEGTYLLVLSILLSIAILLYFFRGNQNFFPGKNWLKPLAYFWIIQNIILAVSVFLRNYHYINYHGLAYRRIGVMAFLVLTIIGLITLFIKVKDKRTTYYLLRLNSWAAYGVLTLLCLINWDVRIAKYNLNHWNSNDIDIDFYFTISDHTLPVIYENLPKVEKQIEAHQENDVRWVRTLDYKTFVAKLERKKDYFLIDYENTDWPSWNMADKKTYQYLKQRELKQLSMQND